MNNWSDYPIFLAVAKSGSLTAAGRKLGLSQPTVGRRLRALEEHFGTALITKKDGALVVTEFGIKVLDNINRMQDEVDAIDRSRASLDRSPSGVVRLSSSEGLGTIWLPSVLHKFRDTNPDVFIELGIGFRDFNLAQREADIALRWRGPGHQNSLYGRKVASVNFGLFASETYLAAKGEPKSVAELQDHDVAVVMMKDDFPIWLNEGKGDTPLPPRVTFRTDNVWAFTNALTMGYGIGVLPLSSHLATETSGLRQILPDVTQCEELWLVAHEDLRKSRRIRTVFDYLVKAFKVDTDHFLKGKPSAYGPQAMEVSQPLTTPSYESPPIDVSADNKAALVK
ncbi:MAG: LysR family transcriptional regulator [Maricaulaceae bacterium]